jgi:hypothetical protein
MRCMFIQINKQTQGTHENYSLIMCQLCEAETVLTNLKFCTVRLQYQSLYCPTNALIIYNVVCIKTCNYLKYFKIS